MHNFLKEGINFPKYKKCIVQLLVIKDLTFDFYNNRPMQMVALRLYMIIYKNLQLINTSDRNINHPKVRKIGNFPFTKQNFF